MSLSKSQINKLTALKKFSHELCESIDKLLSDEKPTEAKVAKLVAKASAIAEKANKLQPETAAA